MCLSKTKLLFFIILSVIGMTHLPSVYSDNEINEGCNFETNYQYFPADLKNNEEFRIFIVQVTGEPWPPRILSIYKFYAWNYKDCGTTPITFTWEFGDGATATGNPVNHVYCKPGKMDIKVTGVDAKGLTDSDEWSKTVSDFDFKDTFMMGKINGFETICNYTIIHPELILFIQLPTTFWIYDFDVNIVISKTYSGFIKSEFICGYFNADYQT